MELSAVNDNANEYLVETSLYKGPLDLLLRLIEREELDITKISLVKVTTPFLAYARQLNSRHAEEVSSFLVMAARLMQIKSEALLPRPPEREPGEEDPGEELLSQLLLYKRYKDIANYLSDQVDMDSRTYLRLVPPPKIEPQLDLSGLSIDNLISAANTIFELASKEEPSLDYVLSGPKITVRDKISFITKTILSAPNYTFRKLLSKKSTRNEIVITFLALLELIKQFRIHADQDTLFGEIQIERSTNWDDTSDFELDF